MQDHGKGPRRRNAAHRESITHVYGHCRIQLSGWGAVFLAEAVTLWRDLSAPWHRWAKTGFSSFHLRPFLIYHWARWTKQFFARGPYPSNWLNWTNTTKPFFNALYRQACAMPGLPLICLEYKRCIMGQLLFIGAQTPLRSSEPKLPIRSSPLQLRKLPNPPPRILPIIRCQWAGPFRLLTSCFNHGHPLVLRGCGKASCRCAPRQAASI